MAEFLDEEAETIGDEGLIREWVSGWEVPCHVVQGLPHLRKRNLVLASDRSQDMNLDQIDERENGWVVFGGRDHGFVETLAGARRMFASEYPISERCGRHTEVMGYLCNAICCQFPRISLLLESGSSLAHPMERTMVSCPA